MTIRYFPEAVWEPTDSRVDENGELVNLWSSRKATRADTRRRQAVLEWLGQDTDNSDPS